MAYLAYVSVLKKMKFLVDTMLGRIARWLRLFGYDTEYTQSEDDDILYRAVIEGRTILTRDIDFAAKAGKFAYLVQSEILWDKLREIVLEFNIEPKLKLTQCPKCNGRIHEVEKNSIEFLVPKYTFLTHDKFWQCKSCKKVYWRGTHVDLAQKDILTKLRLE
jgi:uncharacterized protein with PIN domain